MVPERSLGGFCYNGCPKDISRKLHVNFQISTLQEANYLIVVRSPLIGWEQTRSEQMSYRSVLVPKLKGRNRCFQVLKKKQVFQSIHKGTDANNNCFKKVN